MILDYRQLEALVTTVREGTFKKASEVLHLSQPAISERIRLLEEQLGQPLLVRSVPVEPTTLGSRLINHFHQVRMLERSLVDQLVHQESSDADWLRVPLAVNYDSLATWFVAAVAPLIRQKRILPEIIATNEDLTLEYLRKGQVLGCVSSDPTAITGCHSELLGSFSYRCVASPKTMRTGFQSRSRIEDLLRVPAVIYSREDRFHDDFLEQHFDRVNRRPHYIYVPFLPAMREMILEGYAYGLLPEIDVASDLENGKLVEVTPGKRFRMKLYWHSVQLSNPILKAVSDSIIDSAKAELKKLVED